MAKQPNRDFVQRRRDKYPTVSSAAWHPLHSCGLVQFSALSASVEFKTRVFTIGHPLWSSRILQKMIKKLGKPNRIIHLIFRLVDRVAFLLIAKHPDFSTKTL